MAVHSIHKLSDTEKRLQLLNKQLYGKKENVLSKTDIKQTTLDTKYTIPNTDVAYLKQDLTKILILASTAIVIQFVLYYVKFFERG